MRVVGREVAFITSATRMVAAAANHTWWRTACAPAAASVQVIATIINGGR
jgi:hypothetical protein